MNTAFRKVAVFLIVLATLSSLLAAAPVLAQQNPNEPSECRMLRLIITPTEAAIGETISIKALFIKMGNDAMSYTVTLKINGVVVDTSGFFFYETFWCTACGAYCASAGTEEAWFNVAKHIPGTYSVDVNGLTGSFVVKEKTPLSPSREQEPTPGLSLENPPKPSGISFILGILGAATVQLLIVLILIRKKRSQKSGRGDGTSIGVSQPPDL